MAETPSQASPIHVRFGEFELDEANARVLRNGKAVAMSPTPFGLLCALARHPGMLLTKHTLLDVVWGHRYVSDSVLKGAISDVRITLEDDPQQPRFIETVPRRGYRFIGELVAPSPPVPRPLAVSPAIAPDPAFVGRTREVASLQRAWDRATAGRRVVCWVAGEPGIGKTTLIDHFVRGLVGSTCARGQCVQHYGTTEPYHPVLEALAEICRADAEAPALLRTVAPTWLLQLPWLNTAEQRESLLRELVGVNLERMLREMGEFLDRYTERRALLLITEDLHWADGATIQLMNYLARRRSAARLLWLSSFRLSEVVASEHPLNALRHELRAQDLCEEIVLDSFSESEVAEYVARRAPLLAQDESFVRALHERTEGVPLFVSSVTRDVAARSAGNGNEAAALLANAPVPENLDAIIQHYLGKLGEERRQLLSAAAVCGAEFRIETLARILGRDALWVADTCEQLLNEQRWLVSALDGKHLESGDKPYCFRHALFRQALYERLPPSARAELHRKVGAALEHEQSVAGKVVAAELAMHYDRGRMPAAALRYYSEAAQAALLHVSPAECIVLTDRALRLLDQTTAGAERAAFEITLATLRGVAAFHLLGAGEEAHKAYRRGVSVLADAAIHPMSGLLLHGFGFLLNLQGSYAQALTIADRADALQSTSADPLLSVAASTVRGQAYMQQGRPDEARDVLVAALAAAAEIDTASSRGFIGYIADPQVTMMAMLGLQLLQLGRLRESRERLQQAYTRARRLAQPMALMVTIWFDTLCEIRLGDVERVAALADEMATLVEKYALAQGRSACRWFRGWVQARRGEPLAAFREIRSAYEDNRALGMIAGSSETLGYAAEALLTQGDADSAEQQLRLAFDVVDHYGERIYLPQLLFTESAIARARGQSAQADASLRRAIAEARAQRAQWLELLAFTELCESGAASRDDRAALDALVAALGRDLEAPALARARRAAAPA